MFVIPVAYVFSKLVINGSVGTWILWTAFPIAEIMSVIVASVLFKKVYKKNKIKIDKSPLGIIFSTTDIIQR